MTFQIIVIIVQVYIGRIGIEKNEKLSILKKLLDRKIVRLDFIFNLFFYIFIQTDTFTNVAKALNHKNYSIMN